MNTRARPLPRLPESNQPVAPKSVDLQIAVNSAEGLGILRPQRPGFGKRKEVLPDFGNFPLKLRRLSQPIDDLPIQIRAYTGQFCKALPATAHVFCPFRPQKGTAGGAPERTLQRLLCMFTRPGQQFGDVRISHVELKMR